VKYFKLFEQFNQDSVNESKASDAATKLMDIADQAWDKFGFKSADDVYDNIDKQKQYADLLDAEIKKAGLDKTIYANADKVHDQLEDDNYHHLNAYLALAGYYTPKHQKSYQGYIKGSTSTNWSPDLFEKLLSEKRITFKGKKVNDLYRIVKDADNAMVFVDGNHYSVLDPEEMRNDLQNDITYVYDEDGEEKEIRIADIEFIEM
jgi:hypothetical protein